MGCRRWASLPHTKIWFEKVPATDKTLKIFENCFHERTLRRARSRERAWWWAATVAGH